MFCPKVGFNSVDVIPGTNIPRLYIIDIADIVTGVNLMLKVLADDVKL